MFFYTESVFYYFDLYIFRCCKEILIFVMLKGIFHRYDFCMHAFSIAYVLDVWGAKEGTCVWSTKELSSSFIWTLRWEIYICYYVTLTFSFILAISIPFWLD